MLPITMTCVQVCQIDALYTEQFTCHLPEAVLVSYFEGKAFDYKLGYSEEEKQALKGDIQAIYDRMHLETNTSSLPWATITAGAPGAGKTIYLRKYIERQVEKIDEAAYIDPDDVCLKSMTSTYQVELAEQEAGVEDLTDRIEIRKRLYTKWRPGSNAGAHSILGRFLLDRREFFYGTTSTSPLTGNFFHQLKERGFRIRLLHVTAPDDVRWRSIAERDKVFVQTTEQDTRDKGDFFPQRLEDTYLAYADEIQFLYRSDVHEECRLAATWTRGTPAVLVIHDIEAYKNVQKIHNAICERLGRQELFWENAVEKSFALK
ncbi:MAG: ATP-binding protein [Chlamydiae bacterium]|nr:ATP-binding protein [Chlamydiota bacterium]